MQVLRLIRSVISLCIGGGCIYSAATGMAWKDNQQLGIGLGVFICVMGLWRMKKALEPQQSN